MGTGYVIFSNCIFSLWSGSMTELQHVSACLPDTSAWLAKASLWEYHHLTFSFALSLPQVLLYQQIFLSMGVM